MPLIDLKTDLKDLKFGSNGPYVVKDINNPNPSFIGSKEIYARIDDTIRIGRMLIDKPGITFAAKQAALLALNNNNTEGLKAAAKEVGKEVFNTLSTILKQVPVNGLGIHFHQVPESDRYAGVDGANLARSGGIVPVPFKQMSNLTTAKEDGTVVETVYSIYRPGTPLEPSSLTREESLGPIKDIYDRSNPLIDVRKRQEEVGKPSSLLDSHALATSQLQTQGSNFDEITHGDVANQEQKAYKTFTTQESKVTKVVDFRQSFRKDKPSDKEGKKVEERNAYSLDYSSTEINKEFRVNLGNPGGRKDRTDYFTRETVGQDGINMLDVGEGDGQGTGAARDLIKFKFRIITPDSSRVLYFRAYLDNFGDTFTGNWAGHRYVGRGEEMYTYQGFNRSISLGFKIAAMTRQEMKPIYRKMTYLASSTAPTYNTNGDFMRGTFAQITVGSYIYEMPGIINTVAYNWEQDYPWEIAMQNPEGVEDDDQQELPMVMNAAVTFTPIHNFIPTTGLNHYITNKNPAGGSRKFF